MKQTKLSKQQKAILIALGKEAKKNKGMHYGEVSHLIANQKKLSANKRASISRSIKRLNNRKLIYSKRRSYDKKKGFRKCNVLFITDKGEKVYDKIGNG